QFSEPLTAALFCTIPTHDLDAGLRSFRTLVAVHLVRGVADHRAVRVAGWAARASALGCIGRRGYGDSGRDYGISHADLARLSELSLRGVVRTAENCLDRSRRRFSVRRLGRSRKIRDHAAFDRAHHWRSAPAGAACGLLLRRV